MVDGVETNLIKMYNSSYLPYFKLEKTNNKDYHTTDLIDFDTFNKIYDSEGNIDFDILEKYIEIVISL